MAISAIDQLAAPTPQLTTAVQRGDQNGDRGKVHRAHGKHGGHHGRKVRPDSEPLPAPGTQDSSNAAAVSGQANAQESLSGSPPSLDVVA